MQWRRKTFGHNECLIRRDAETSNKCFISCVDLANKFLYRLPTLLALLWLIHSTLRLWSSETGDIDSDIELSQYEYTVYGLLNARVQLTLTCWTRVLQAQPRSETLAAAYVATTIDRCGEMGTFAFFSIRVRFRVGTGDVSWHHDNEWNGEWLKTDSAF
jgi:hypothetical protein